MNVVAAVALSVTGVGYQAIASATRYEEYLVLAATCGVDAERAKVLFDEEVLKPGGFDGALRRAKERVTSGAA